MLKVAALLFALAAAGGLALAILHFKKKTAPLAVALLHGLLLHQFLVATETGKLDELARALADDAILLSDGANLGSAPPVPIAGAESVTQFLADRSESLFPRGKVIRKWSLFQKMPLFLGYRDGELNYALAFSFRGNFIQKLFLITCPVRLRFLSAQCSGAVEVDLKTF